MDRGRRPRASKTGGTAEGPAFRPGRTKAGYVFSAPERGRSEPRRYHRWAQAHQVRPRRGPHPARLLQHRGRPAGAAAPAAPSRDGPADRARRPGAALPDGAHRAGGEPASGRSRSRIRCARRTRSTGRRRCIRAHRLEQALDTPAHIYYKYEGVSPSGSHKPNTAHRPGLLQQAGGRQAPRHRDGRGPVGQRAGVRRRGLRARGQGLHGPRQLRPEAVPAHPHGDYGAEVVASPAPTRTTAASVLAEDARLHRARWASPSARPSRTRRPTTTRSTRSARCSTTCCCTRRSSARRRIEQMAMAGESPTSSSAAPAAAPTSRGSTFPFIGQKLRGEADYRVIAVEPEAAPSLTRGVYEYDFGDTGRWRRWSRCTRSATTSCRPHPRRRAALSRHGAAGQPAQVEKGIIEARAVHQVATFEAGVQFARAEGILPAPEPDHAIRWPSTRPSRPGRRDEPR